MNTQDSTTIPSLLWKLSHDISSKVKEQQALGTLVHFRTMYVKSKIEDLVYNEGGLTYRTSMSNVEREEWHWSHQANFIEQVIKQLPSYKDCLAAIGKQYSLDRDQAESMLMRYCQKLTNAAIDPVTDEKIVDNVATFVNDLQGGLSNWNALSWLHGIWLEESEYRLSDQLLIRRPTPSDLETERAFDILPYLDHPIHDPQPSAMLEVAARGKDASDIQRQIESVLYVLRLFRVGSVVATKYTLRPHSFTKFGGTIGTGVRITGVYKYGLRSSDIDSLGKLLHVLKPLLPSPFGATPETPDPVSLSFTRYQDAILQQVSIESRITSAITSLEALYLRANERSELVHRLSQRISALMRLFGFPPVEVYNIISQSYEIRSSFVHGSFLDGQQRLSALKLCEKVLDFARLSLIVFFQLRATLEKEALISKLDNSLLDPHAFEKLRTCLPPELVITK